MVFVEFGVFMFLDVNNVYVNSVNYGYDVYDFIDKFFLNKIVYGYIVGYFDEVLDLKVDIYGVDVIELVWVLFDYVYCIYGVFFIFLECDFNLLFLGYLFDEVC